MRKLAIFLALAALGAASAATAAGAVPADGAAGRVPANDHARGLVFDGLRPGAPEGPCAGGFEITMGAETLCTHGPDAAPPGRDVRGRRGMGELQAAAIEAAGSAAAAGAGAVPVIGDGTSGNRVLAIYAVAADRPDRYAQVAPLIAGWAAQMDATVNASAAATGGERHLRFVTDASGALVVARVILPVDGDDYLSNTIDALKAMGYNDPARKYLIWADAGVYCGIATIYKDDRAIAENYNNGLAPMYARIDQGCWGSAASVELHELVHNLGGVQLSAPHGTSAWHCTDEYDRLCYADGANVQMSYSCPQDMEKYLDCGHDDYFHTSPPEGSYLATHWNVAASSFLHAGPLDGVATPPPLPPPTNQAPVVGVAAPSAITLPGTAVLDGTVSDDGLPGPYTVSWSKASGPGDVVFAAPGSEDTAAAFSTAGVYQLRLTASDGALTGSATATVSVYDPGPVATTVTFSGTLSKRYPTRSFSISAAEGPAGAALTFGARVPGTRVAARMTLSLYDSGGVLLATASGASPVQISLPLGAGTYTWKVSGSKIAFSLTVNHYVMR